MALKQLQQEDKTLFNTDNWINKPVNGIWFDVLEYLNPRYLALVMQHRYFNMLLSNHRRRFPMTNCKLFYVSFDTGLTRIKPPMVHSLKGADTYRDFRV